MHCIAGYSDENDLMQVTLLMRDNTSISFENVLKVLVDTNCYVIVINQLNVISYPIDVVMSLKTIGYEKENKLKLKLGQ